MQETRTIISRVEAYGPKPRSAKQALEQAHALLSEEGQWTRGKFFEDGDASEAFEKSACGKWSACAMGAIGLVTGEMPITVSKEWDEWDNEDRRDSWVFDVQNGHTDLSLEAWVEDNPIDSAEYWWDIDGSEPDVGSHDTPLMWRSAQFLAAAICEIEGNTLDGYILEDPTDTVFTYNDATGRGRTEVLKAFEAAIKKAATGKLTIKETS